MTATATLYVVPASHPCVAVMKALEIKGVPYRRVDLPFGLSNVVQRVRFGRRTVPGLTIGDRRVVGSRAIMRALEEEVPEPALLPADPRALAAVDAADEWGDLVLQEQARWIGLTAVAAGPQALASFTEGYRFPRLPAWTYGSMGALVRAEGRLLGHVQERIIGEYLPALPAHVDHVDDLIATGVIGGPSPNVADLQILSSVRLLLNFGDLAPHLEGRPCAQRARALFPDYPGHAPAGLLPSPFPEPARDPAHVA